MTFAVPVSAENICALSRQVLNRSDLKHSRGVPTIEDALGFCASKKARKAVAEAVAQISPGMSVAPTFYKPIPKGGRSGKDIRNEYRKKVRPRANAYLAMYHERDLRTKLGFDDKAIERMREGLSPRDAQGNFYDFTWDHIIEIGGSGRLSQETAPDPKLANLPGWPPMGPTCPVNHLNNLFAIPESEHAHKNTIMGKMVGGQQGAAVTLSYVRESAGDDSPPFLGLEAAKRTPPTLSQSIGFAEYSHEALTGILDDMRDTGHQTPGDDSKRSAMPGGVATDQPAGPGVGLGRAALTRLRAHLEDAESAWRDSMAAIAAEGDAYQAGKLLKKMRRAVKDLQQRAGVRLEDGSAPHARLQALYREAQDVLPQPPAPHGGAARPASPGAKPRPRRPETMAAF